MNYFVRIYEIFSRFSISVLYGFIIGVFYRQMSLKHKLTRNRKSGFNRDTSLSLIPRKFFTREEIINIGKKAIRCPITNKIMVNPVVAQNGFSYEKEVLKEDKIFENRNLKEFLEKLGAHCQLNHKNHQETESRKLRKQKADSKLRTRLAISKHFTDVGYRT